MYFYFPAAKAELNWSPTLTVAKFWFKINEFLPLMPAFTRWKISVAPCHIRKKSITFRYSAFLYSSPFCSCVLSDLALYRKRGWGWLVLRKQTSLLFIYKCKLVSIRTAWSTYEKEWGLYQNKVTPSLTSSPKPGPWYTTVKWAFYVTKWFSFICCWSISILIFRTSKIISITLCVGKACSLVDCL